MNQVRKLQFSHEMKTTLLQVNVIKEGAAVFGFFLYYIFIFQ